MEQADRETIKRKIAILSKDMDFVGVTLGLIARGIFENYHVERFKSERSKMEKNMALLMEIETRGPKAFAGLVESLIEANQKHLAQELGYPSSGPSQGRMGQAQATTSSTPVWPARDGTGDYRSTPVYALSSYTPTMVDSGIVNYKLSRDFESYGKEKYKQISAPANMLTRDLYFFSKQERESSAIRENSF